MTAARPTSLMEAFEQSCPYYMMYGMTYEQFWDGDVCAHKMFREKYRIESEQNMVNNNFVAWMNGIYVAQAIGAALNGKKNAYPKEPLKLFSTRDERKAERRRKAEDAAMQRAKTAMEIYMVNFNKRMNAKLDGKEGNAVGNSTGN